jgi:8-oxo-dGTP pyrophosphatase MutT (NUDIX family)
VVEHGGKVVLARNRAWPVAFYGLISGFLERGEAPEEGALREVKEELGRPSLLGTCCSHPDLSLDEVAERLAKVSTRAMPTAADPVHQSIPSPNLRCKLQSSEDENHGSVAFPSFYYGLSG